MAGAGAVIHLVIPNAPKAPRSQASVSLVIADLMARVFFAFTAIATGAVMLAIPAWGFVWLLSLISKSVSVCSP